MLTWLRTRREHRQTRREQAVLRTLTDFGPLPAWAIAKLTWQTPGSNYPDLYRLEISGRIESVWSEPRPETGLRHRIYRLPTAEGGDRGWTHT